MREVGWLFAFWGAALLLIGLNAPNVWFVMLGIVLLPIGLWNSREKLRELYDQTIYRVTSHKVGLGTSLVILGLGIAAMLLPNMLRYVFQNDAYLSGFEFMGLGLAATMISGGWFLRKSTDW
jgi:hypothetical protein